MANVLQQVLQRQAMQDHLDEKLQQVKPALSHVGMYIGLIAYTAIGALVSATILYIVQRGQKDWQLPLVLLVVC